MAKWEVARMRYQKRGFRAKISDGWFVWRDDRAAAGPFESKPLARIERDRLKRRESMQDKDKAGQSGSGESSSKTSETTSRTTETESSKSGGASKGDDPSDSESSKKTSDGSGPDDK